MSKYTEVAPDIQEQFDRFISNIEGLGELNIKVIGCPKLKDVCKVSKSNDLLKHLTENDVIILINEAIFDALEPEQQLMVIEENIARIYFDAEKGKVTLNSPDFETFSLLLIKYGAEKCLNLKLLLKELLNSEEDGNNEETN